VEDRENNEFEHRQQIESKLDVYVRVAVEFSRVEQSNGEVL
jgi:hypothetical protein